MTSSRSTRRSRPAGRRGDLATDRSTRRRSDAPDLPTRPVERRTVGAVVHRAGRQTYRPVDVHHADASSYGKVIPGDRRPGRPDPVQLPARRAGRAALPQAASTAGCRTCAAAPDTRSSTSAPSSPAPSGPALPRGDPRRHPTATIKAVTKATYLQLWWPQMDHPVYVDTGFRSGTARDYRDPDTGFPLTTWDRRTRQPRRGPRRQAGPRDAVRASRSTSRASSPARRTPTGPSAT